MISYEIIDLHRRGTLKALALTTVNSLTAKFREFLLQYFTMTTKSFLIQDVRLFTGDHVIQSGYVLVNAGGITAVGAGPPPPGITADKRMSFPNHTLLPGFIDCHVHAFMGDDRCMSASLEFGITTVLDMHNEPEFVKKLKALVADESSYATHADFKTSGLAASIKDGYPFKLITDFVKDPEAVAASETWTQLKDPEEAESYIDDRINEGSDYIKLLHESGKTWGWELPLPTLELQVAIVQAAKKRGLKTVAHAMSKDDTLTVLRAGVDGMAHTFCDEPITSDLVEEYKTNNVWVCPTLAATGSMTTEGAEDQHNIAHDPRVHSLIGEEESDRICACMGTCHGRGKLEYAIDSVKVLREAGIDIVW